MRPMSASARYRPLLAWRLKSKSFGHTRKRTRVVASKSTWDFPIRLKPTRNKRSQGNIEAVPFVSQVYSNEAPSLSRNEVVRMTSAQWIGLAILAVLFVPGGFAFRQGMKVRPEDKDPFSGMPPGSPPG